MAVKLELSTDGGVATSVDRAETSMVRVVTSSGESTEVSGSQVVGVGAGANGERHGAHLSGGVTNASNSRGINTSSSQLSQVSSIQSTSTDEGEDVGATLDVGEDQVSSAGEATRDGAYTSISIEVISVVVPLVVAELHNIITLDNPDQLLDGVVEVELDFHVSIDSRLITSELELLDQVLVGSLGEAAALISVKVDVVNVERSILQRGDAESIKAVGGDTASRERARGRDVQLALGADVELNLDFVVLESNEGQSKTHVAAEPELEGDIEGGGLSRAQTSAGQSNGVANHVVITSAETSGERELVPDGQPVTVLFVNTLTTDLDFDRLNQHVADIVDPAEESRRGGSLHTGQGHLEVHAVDQITVAGDGAGHLLTEVSLAVEDLLDGFHAEVGVATIHGLKVRNLGVTCEVNILGAIGDELHKTTGHFCFFVLYTIGLEKNSGKKRKITFFLTSPLFYIFIKRRLFYHFSYISHTIYIRKALERTKYFFSYILSISLFLRDLYSLHF